MSNLDTYNKLKTVPQDGLKKITGGRLKGMSDIKPQWRIEKMTEVFGVCGIGWKFEVTKKWTEQGTDNQIFAFADVNVYVKVGGEWSDAVSGNGGSMLVVKEKFGMHNNDEAFKMAVTDAIGTACKFFGLAADVYRGYSDSKYIQPPETKQQVKPKTIWLTETQYKAIIEGLNSGDEAKIEKSKAFYESKKKAPYAIKKEWKTEIDKLIK